MEVVVAVVMSLDGKLTRHDEPNQGDWASSEEQAHFHKLLDQHDCVVFGSGTYKVVKDSLQFNVKRLRVVLTSKPEKYESKSMPGKLEFSSETPKALVKRLAAHGYKKLIVTGGPHMISDFLQHKLVDTLYVSLEPRLFGTGKSLLADLPMDIKVKLKSLKQLNPGGTLLLTYSLT